MIIKKIELINITTHKKTNIEFQHGLNLLFGKNGTGKSTVLNMIGYTLFNYLPGNQKSYVRRSRQKNKKYGIVKVTLVGLHDELYVIKRSIANPNTMVEVSYGNAGRLIPGINTISDLEEWMKTQLSLKAEINLSDLFKTSIGVPQGTFTEPFLRSPRLRKDFFNPILQVDIYREVWKKLLEVIKEFDEEIYVANNKKTQLETRLEPFEEYIEKETLYQDNLEKTQEELKSVKQNIENLEKEYEKKKNTKTYISELELTIKEKKENKKNLRSQLKNLEEKLEDSKKSAEICKNTKKNYNEYENSLIEQKKVQKLNEKLRSINESLSKLQNQYTELKSSQKEINSQIIEIQGSKKDFKALKEKNELYENIKEKIEQKRDIASKIDAAQQRLEDLKSKNVKLTEKITKIEKSIDKRENIEKDVEKLEKLDKKRQQLELQLNSIRTEINQFKENLQISSEGKCPILNEDCKNIGNRSFKTIFQEKIEESSNQLQPLEKEYLTVKSEIEALQNSKEELEKKQGLIHELEILKERKIDLGKEIKETITFINNNKDISRDLKKLQKQTESLKPAVDKFTILKNNIEIKLPKLNKKKQNLENKIEPLSEKIKPLKKKKEELELIPLKLTNLNKKLENLKDDHDKYQENQKLANNLEKLVKEFEKNKKFVQEIDNRLNSLNQELKSLLEDFDKREFQNIEKELSTLRERKGKLENSTKEIRERLDEVNKKLDSFETYKKELDIVTDKLISLEFMKEFSEIMRSYFNTAGPKVTEVLLKHINAEATNHYRAIMDNPNIILEWDKDYMIKIKTADNTKEFTQLSGGEQMSAALAVRLAILKVLSNAEFAFFDEPTINLDTERRENLANVIQRIQGFQQLFVISHDDTFEESVENVIHFTKDDTETTKVEYLGNP
ncbi:MAG: AAA family ATPase [Candidatus Lokiarchaeota archaeon]|nr:AAA family ATPase [Candidatus Lokiarchaeota archaeon]MBD3198563.1 AAA family ATPase [Candidatus Lokiarchaeota archaeon]